MLTNAKVPLILEEERTPLVEKLLEIIREQQKQIDNLKNEIDRLKKKPKKPNIKPNTLPKAISIPPLSPAKLYAQDKSKKRKLTYHETHVIEATHVPVGSVFKGYKNYDVQDIMIEMKNTRFRLARWLTPEGTYHTAALPSGYAGYHFGPTLRAYI